LLLVLLFDSLFDHLIVRFHIGSPCLGPKIIDRPPSALQLFHDFSKISPSRPTSQPFQVHSDDRPTMSRTPSVAPQGPPQALDQYRTLPTALKVRLPRSQPSSQADHVAPRSVHYYGSPPPNRSPRSLQHLNLCWSCQAHHIPRVSQHVTYSWKTRPRSGPRRRRNSGVMRR
jgi:hypothetical protein